MMLFQDKDTSQSKQNSQSSSTTFIYKTLIIPSFLDSCFISSTVSEDKRAMLCLDFQICAQDKNFSSICAYTTMMLPRVRNHHGGKCVHPGLSSSKKAKIVESKIANNLEPTQLWGSNAMDVPSSSSLVNDKLSILVYYVERLRHNLFSVGQFCDADLKVAFRKNTCFIRNLEGVDLLSGSRDTNLYIISPNDMLKTSPICLLSKALNTKSWLWHRRLSHLNFDTLNKVAKDSLARGIPKLKFQKDHLCSTCSLGKSKKSSHQPKAKDTNQEKLYHLHMDLCCPMRVESINEKKYILVIVDDYSRFTWVKFLRSKDEDPKAIIKCIKNIQVRLNATVRNVITDNGTEFVNQTLRDFYENVGISHQTSVARTPQQNGIVERRNQTLVEAARTMLIFSKAPLFPWAEAIHTACYTQNRSLICLRYNKTPYELMHDKKLDLSFLHVFGLVCYPTNDSEDLESYPLCGMYCYNDLGDNLVLDELEFDDLYKPSLITLKQSTADPENIPKGYTQAASSKVAMITARIRKFMRKTEDPLTSSQRMGSLLTNQRLNALIVKSWVILLGSADLLNIRKTEQMVVRKRRLWLLKIQTQKPWWQQTTMKKLTGPRNLILNRVFVLMGLMKLEEDDWSMEIDAEPVHFGQDGLGDFDWSNKADDTPVSLALMATNSKVPYCSKCSKSYKRCLKTIKLKVTNFQRLGHEILGFGVESSSSKESDNSSGNTNSTESLYPNFQKTKGFHAVPPPTGTIIPPRANVSFTGIDETSY
ncbi:retrovirus-related pol polyprotein from transposon TNT 1-94 [Tanacetum coccineum]